jgi:formylglycine-generating enzyme required for sulfatase activity
LVSGGWFQMGRGLDGPDSLWGGKPSELPEHPAYVGDFYLDTFEVTVGRFRPFVEAYPDSIPDEGAGAHPKIAGTGWHAAWAQHMPATRAALEAKLGCTPIGSPAGSWITGSDTYPINCIDWYVAFAFCVWEGGRLPTEAEWEYAAAGGDEDRMFPYGPYGKTVAWEEDEFSCASEDQQTDCFGLGEAVRGYGRWGHMDLAGSIGEWVLDEYAPYSGAECVDCAPFTTDHVVRVNRGGSWHSLAEYTRAAWRDDVDPDFPTSGSTGNGIRCARSP